MARSYGNSNFLRTSKLFLQVTAPFYFPQIVYEHSNLSTSSFFYFSRPRGYRVLSRCGFDSCFLDD
jgi:hypothetical protein